MFNRIVHSWCAWPRLTAQLSRSFADACIEYLPLSIRYLYLSNTNITNAVRALLPFTLLVQCTASILRQACLLLYLD
jgi:hypothetical protein